MFMTTSRVLLIDSDEASAAWLLAELRKQGFAAAEHVTVGLQVTSAIARLRPDLVVLNHHFDRPDDVLACSIARLAAPDAVVVALAAAGPTVRELRRWAAESRAIDAVIEKPLPEGQLRARLAELAAGNQAARAVRARSQRIASLLPEGALDALDGEEVAQEEMFEAAVLFTDVRRSSDLVTRAAPRDYFRQLNASLSRQSAIVRACRGSVVKYTGDGLMAVFRGMGRSHLAMRCAQSLREDELQAALPFGVGIAEGLVLSGLVGASDDPTQRAQYDVIGATVHLAARLCALAQPGGVVATRAILQASRLAPPLDSDAAVQVRGFAAPIACVSFGARPAPELA